MNKNRSNKTMNSSKSTVTNLWMKKLNKIRLNKDYKKKNSYKLNNLNKIIRIK